MSLAMFNQPSDCHSFCCIDAEEMLRAFSRLTGTERKNE
ncbi:hypothetical protein SD77_3197 [Bacillus badius]|uniref:Uncharacterized protein n=1 Tax=Bacillus badius TaxID=1455 RepID=A0ABR5AX57_BACBA|nr:hypothetical protein SD77_3197 [Bacillus badius]